MAGRSRIATNGSDRQRELFAPHAARSEPGSRATGAIREGSSAAERLDRESHSGTGASVDGRALGASPPRGGFGGGAPATRVLMRSPPPVVAYTVKIVDPSALGGRLPKGIRSRPAAERRRQSDATEEPKPVPPPETAEEKRRSQTGAAETGGESRQAAGRAEEGRAKARKRKRPPPKPTPPRGGEAQAFEGGARQARARSRRSSRRRAPARREKGSGKHALGPRRVEQGKGAALGTGGDGGGGGVLMGLDFIIYKNQVEAIIKKNWTWVGANPNLTIRVGFRIGDGGDITDVRVLDQSGDSSFDDSVMRAMQHLEPAPRATGQVSSDLRQLHARVRIRSACRRVAETFLFRGV